jgi:hypothetical protein
MVGPEDLVIKLEQGVATAEEIQQLRDIGCLTPMLEKLHRVDINKCLRQKIIYQDVNLNPFPEDQIPAALKNMLSHGPITEIKVIVISDGAFLIQFREGEVSK